MATNATLNDFFCQQAQGPVGVPFGRIATRQAVDFHPLGAINDDRATGTRRISQALQAACTVAISPCRNGGIVYVQGCRNCLKRLATVKFEQGSRTFEVLDGQRAFGKQCLKFATVAICKCYVLFVYSVSLAGWTPICRKILLTE